MPRSPRKKSSSGIYHIILRGNEQQDIFREQKDYHKFLSILAAGREKTGIILYAWCLMPNHIHLLLRETRSPVSSLISSISSGYVFWFNAKYSRVGHLFQGRYFSEPVENESYFLSVLRYIHLNPVKARLCVDPGKYRFSSYRKYFNEGKFANEDMIFGLIRKDELERFHQEKADDIRSDHEEQRKRRLSDDEVRILAGNYIGNGDIRMSASLPRPVRADMIRELLENGASLSQLNRLTGLRISVIRAIGKNG